MSPYRGTTNSQSNTSTDTDDASGEDLCPVRWRICRTNVGAHGNGSEDLFQDIELETLKNIIDEKGVGGFSRIPDTLGVCRTS